MYLSSNGCILGIRCRNLKRKTTPQPEVICNIRNGRQEALLHQILPRQHLCRKIFRKYNRLILCSSKKRSCVFPILTVMNWWDQGAEIWIHVHFQAFSEQNYESRKNKEDPISHPNTFFYKLIIISSPDFSLLETFCSQLLMDKDLWQLDFSP